MMDKKEVLIKVTVSIFIALLALMVWKLHGMDDEEVPQPQRLHLATPWNEESQKSLVKDIYEEYLLLKAKKERDIEEEARLVRYIHFLNRQERFIETPPTPIFPRHRGFLRSSMCKSREDVRKD